MQGRRLAAIVILCVFGSALAAGLVFVRATPESVDAKIMLVVTESILEHGNFTPRLDMPGVEITTSNYGLGMSLLLAGPYEAARLLHANPVRAAMATNAVVYAVLAVALLALARVLDATWPQALVTTVLIAAGSMVLPYVASGFSEPAMAVAVAAGLTAVGGARRRRPWAAPLGGAAAGAATLLRTDSLLLIVPVLAAALVLECRDWRVLVRFAAGGAPFAVIWGWYNAVRFGAPWRLGYEHTHGFSFPFGRGLYGLTLAPGRGVLWYAPILVLAVAGFRWAWRRDAILAAAAAVLFLVRPIFFASWFAWGGGWGWGPRFLATAMPALTVGVVEVVRRFPRFARPARVAVVAVVALSIGVQLLGTAVDYVPWNALSATRPVRNFDTYLFQWKYFPIMEQAKWVVTGEARYAGLALPPRRRPRLFTALVGTALLAALTAAEGARVLHEGSRPARPITGAGSAVPGRSRTAAASAGRRRR